MKIQSSVCVKAYFIVFNYMYINIDPVVTYNKHLLRGLGYVAAMANGLYTIVLKNYALKSCDFFYANCSNIFKSIVKFETK